MSAPAPRRPKKPTRPPSELFPAPPTDCPPVENAVRRVDEPLAPSSSPDGAREGQPPSPDLFDALPAWMQAARASLDAGPCGECAGTGDVEVEVGRHRCKPTEACNCALATERETCLACEGVGVIATCRACEQVAVECAWQAERGIERMPGCALPDDVAENLRARCERTKPREWAKYADLRRMQDERRNTPPTKEQLATLAGIAEASERLRKDGTTGG